MTGSKETPKTSFEDESFDECSCRRSARCSRRCIRAWRSARARAPPGGTIGTPNWTPRGGSAPVRTMGRSPGPALGRAAAAAADQPTSSRRSEDRVDLQTPIVILAEGHGLRKPRITASISSSRLGPRSSRGETPRRTAARGSSTRPSAFCDERTLARREARSSSNGKETVVRRAAGSGCSGPSEQVPPVSGDVAKDGDTPVGLRRAGRSNLMPAGVYVGTPPRSRRRGGRTRPGRRLVATIAAAAAPRAGQEDARLRARGRMTTERLGSGYVVSAGGILDQVETRGVDEEFMGRLKSATRMATSDGRHRRQPQRPALAIVVPATAAS